MPFRRWPLAAVLSAAVIACNTPDSTGPSPLVSAEFTISPTEQWSGGTVEIRSAVLREISDSQLAFLAGELTLPARRTSDTTIEVTLPSLPTTPLSIRAAAVGDTTTVGVVQIYGFAGVHQASQPVMNSSFRQMLDPAAGTVLGVVPVGDSQVVASLNLRTGFVTPYPSITYLDFGDYGPMPSYLTSEVVARGGSYERWSLAGGGQLLDTLTGGMGRYLVRIGSGTWFTSDNHWGYTFTDSATVTDWIGLESIWGFVYSPDRTLVIPLMNASDSAPIYNGTTGRFALRVASMGQVRAAAFSADNKTVYLGGSAYWGGVPMLEAVDMATGTVIARDTSLTSQDWPMGMALDPAGQQLYVVVSAGAEGRIQLRVYQTPALTRLAILEPDSGAATCASCWIAPTSVSMSDRRLYTAPRSDYSKGRTTTIPIYAFDLLPRYNVVGAPGQ